MPADVRLQSLEFKSACGNNGIASVKVTLTNGLSSPVFEKEGVMFDNEKRLDFDAYKLFLLRNIQGGDNNGNLNFVRSVKFKS